MEAPLLHEKSEKALAALWNGGAHGMLLSGPVGVGLSTIAEYFSRQSNSVTLWVRPEKDEKIDYEKGSITVAQIRSLYETLKTVDKKGRIVVIDSAERMAEPAQNAFLKLLEEPPQGVRFVLLSHTPTTLLPTIHSRVQSLELHPIERAQSETLLDQLVIIDPTKRAQLLFIAAGLPAEIHRLAADEEYFRSRAGIVRDARTFISGSPYERLKIAHAYKDSRPKALQLLEDSMKQLRQTVTQSGDTSALARIPKLLGAYKAVRQNGNVRLQLAATLVV